MPSQDLERRTDTGACHICMLLAVHPKEAEQVQPAWLHAPCMTASKLQGSPGSREPSTMHSCTAAPEISPDHLRAARTAVGLSSRALRTVGWIRSAHLVKGNVLGLKELCLKRLHAWTEAVRSCEPGSEQQIGLANDRDVPVCIWGHDLQDNTPFVSPAFMPKGAARSSLLWLP